MLTIQWGSDSSFQCSFENSANASLGMFWLCKIRSFFSENIDGSVENRTIGGDFGTRSSFDVYTFIDQHNKVLFLAYTYFILIVNSNIWQTIFLLLSWFFYSVHITLLSIDKCSQIESCVLKIAFVKLRLDKPIAGVKMWDKFVQVSRINANLSYFQLLCLSSSGE